MDDLTEVPIESKMRLRPFYGFGGTVMDRIGRLARKLSGRPVIHINATAAGGGVAEMLKSQVPFERALGIDSHWYVMQAPPRFFAVTKKIHNLLQGMPGALADREQRLYLSVNHGLSRALAGIMKKHPGAIVVLHDPQPLPLAAELPAGTPVISRLHVDLSSPRREMVAFLKVFLKKCGVAIVSDLSYSRALGLPPARMRVIAPAIDPLSEKNRPMKLLVARKILEEFGINPLRPIAAQVSRFDVWKDPLGVIRAYYIAKKDAPELQLVLAGFSLAQDDPESKAVYDKVLKHARGDKDIFLFINPRRLRDVSNDSFINAVYTASTVIIQKSLREGFGLTMTEAMWKGKAVVAGMTRGAVVQIRDGYSGVLASSVEEAGAAVAQVLKDKKFRAALGEHARESVLKHFLLPRYIKENLEAYLACQ